MQINFLGTFYSFLLKLFDVELIGPTSICSDASSKSFEKLYLETTKDDVISHHKHYEYGVIPARILVEIELKLNPFVKKS